MSGMTYTSLVVDIQNYAERSDDPFMARMFEEFGVVPALLLLKSSVVLAAYLYLIPWQFGSLVMGLLCVFYCFVVAHNIHQLQVK